MSRRILAGIMLTGLLVGMLSSTFGVQLSGTELAGHVKPDAVGSLGFAATDWNKTYGGTGYDYAYSLVQTSDGGYAVAGATWSLGAGAADGWLVKTDEFGNEQWNKTYGGTHVDHASCVVQTGDGGYALAGSTDSYGAGSDDVWLVKTDASGNALWNKTYGGANYDAASSIVSTSDGGYALAGGTYSFGVVDEDFYLVKTDSSGNMQWNKTYGGNGTEVISCVVQTGDGGYAAAGLTNCSGAGGYDFWLVKTDSSGNMQWNKTYGGTSDEHACSVVQSSDGGYAIVGYTNSFGVAGSRDVWLVKTDVDGVTEWNRTYGGTDYDAPYSMIRTSDGGYAISCYTLSYGAGGDLLLVKTDSVGIVQWSRTCGGPNSDQALSVVQTSDGGYTLAGCTNSYGAGYDDFWLVKFAPAPIHIRADGSVDPPTVPIQRNGDLYTLTDNIYTGIDGILIERSNMTLDGAGYTLQGNGNNTGSAGLLLALVNNVTVRNMKIESFSVAVALDRSNNDTIVGNNITANTDRGIYISGSSNNSINANNIANNLYGLIISPSSTTNNIISANNITSNYYGLFFYETHNNSIFHNNIMNGIQIIIYNSSSADTWDNGYPSGGNYWSDYNGTDTYRGAFQNVTGSDGIGDVNYFIDANNMDHYPLMGPYGSSTRTGANTTVFPTDNVGLIFDNVTAAGSTSVNETGTGPAPPSGFKLEGQYYDITTTANYSGKIMVRIVYDDANMTLEEETSLFLAYWNETTMQWVNITSYVDTVNNVIYGETAHLSGHGVFSIEIHDVKVSDVTLSKTVVGQGFTARINVTVANPGDFDETSYLTAYASALTIETRQITVGNGSGTVVTFVFNSAGFAKANYTIQAIADTVSGETNLADNTLPGGWLVVTISGDINGDFKVGPADFALLSAAYGSTPSLPKWNPNADINSDDKVGPADFAQLSAHYGQHYP